MRILEQTTKEIITKEMMATRIVIARREFLIRPMNIL